MPTSMLCSKEEIYVEQPEGFIDRHHPNWVCQLSKSIYGLKQAACVWWNHKINKYLCKNGFKPTSTNTCLYYAYDGKHIIFIALYVNDCMIMAPHGQTQWIKDLIMKKFPFTDLGPAMSVLSIEIIHDQPNGKLFLCQHGKIVNALNKFGMINCKPIDMPMVAGLSLNKIECTNEKVKNFPFHLVIRTLNYVT